MKRLQITLHDDQATFLEEFKKISRMSQSEVIRQCLDRCADDLIGSMEAMRKHGFRPATAAERKATLKKVRGEK